MKLFSVCCLIAVSISALSADTMEKSVFDKTFFKKVAKKQKGNFVVSPYSIKSASKILYKGAFGKTKAEFDFLFAFSKKNFRDFESNSSKYSKRVLANAITVNKRFKLRSEFVKECKSENVEVFNENFSDKNYLSGKINGWVAQKTDSVIRKILNPADVKEDCDLIITNAIYFKSEWELKFNKRNTHEADFTTEDGVVQKVSMMSGNEKYSVMTAEGYSELELPFKDSTVSMFFILPDSGKSVSDIINSDSDIFLSNGLDGFTKEKTVVLIPKFDISLSPVSVKSELKALGLNSVFSRNADFSVMDKSKTLYVSDFFHTARIVINEDGGEAAAASAVMMARYSIPKRFVLNRPFIFFVRNNSDGSVLFAGVFRENGEK